MIKKRGLWFSSFLIGLFIFLGLASLSKIDLITDAKSKANSNHLSILMMALENFKEHVGRYPSTKEGLSALMFPPKKSAGWNGPYITKEWLESLTSDFDKDPWGTKYIYIYPHRYRDELYELYSCGKDQQDDLGQNDDITN